MKILGMLLLSINILFAAAFNLTSGETETDSVSINVMNMYKISAHNGDKLKVVLDELSADADIYVKLGSRATKDSHDCTSLNGMLNSELCELDISSNTDVYIGVYGYHAADYALTATITAGAADIQVLEFNTPVDASVEKDAFKYYKVAATNGEVVSSEISNLEADADIYVKVGSKPGRNSFDCKSTNGSVSVDSCSVTMNADADVYIGVFGYRATDYTVKVTAEAGNSVVALSSGVALSKHIQQGKDTFYTISGQAGESVSVVLDHLTDDADLSIREGSKPTDATFDCKSSKGGTTTDSCSLTFSESGELFIRVYGYRTSDYQIKATIGAGNNIPTLISDVSVSGSVALNQMKYYKIPAESGQTVEVLMDLLTDDADLYVKRGSKPTRDSADCRSTKSETNAESCSLTVAENQDVFIGIFGYKASDYRLKATTSNVDVNYDPIVLEDAEDGSLNPNWVHELGDVAPFIVPTPHIPGAPVNSTGTMVQMADGNADTQNLYTLPVNNTTHNVLSMDCGGLPDVQLYGPNRKGYITHYYVGVRVETKFGPRFMKWYSFYNHGNVSAFKSGVPGGNVFLNYPSPVETTSGYYMPVTQWNHFEVNIEEQLQILEPGNKLYKIIEFYTTGGFLDNITLSYVPRD